jgi:hypothetical protein
MRYNYTIEGFVNIKGVDMIFKRLGLAVLLTSLFIPISNAGLVIDPYVGVGSYAISSDVSSIKKSGNKGFNSVGSRLGFSFTLLSAGIDYQIDSATSMNRKNLSAFVGFEFPILLRVWGEYMLSSTLKDDNFKDTTIAFKEGMSVGVGFTALPLISINFEIEKSKYNYESLPVIGDQDVDFVSYLMSVSLPLDL